MGVTFLLSHTDTGSFGQSLPQELEESSTLYLDNKKTNARGFVQNRVIQKNIRTLQAVHTEAQL